EIQLRDGSQFILDRAPIDVLPVIPEATLLLGTDQKPKAGSSVTVAALGANHVPVELHVLEPGPRGGWSPSYESDYLEPRGLAVDPRPAGSAERASISVQTPYNGARRLAALWPAAHDFGEVLLGTLDYFIAPNTDTSPSMVGFGTTMGGTYFVGEP